MAVNKKSCFFKLDCVVTASSTRAILTIPTANLELEVFALMFQAFIVDEHSNDATLTCFQITYTIAKTYQPLKPGTILSFQNAALGSIGELLIIIMQQIEAREERKSCVYR